MKLIEIAREIAERFYDKNTYEHAMRVATFVTENDLIPKDMIEDCVVLAIMHDLIEDTLFDFNTDFAKDYGVKPYLYDCLKILTRNKNTSYIDYLKNIKDNYKNYPEAYWVKIADMKDHLSQTDTLSDRLRDKYITALPYLL